MKVFGGIVLTVLTILAVIVFGGLSIGLGWFDTFLTNKVNYVDQKIDDRTNYNTRKKVEDTARASIASYKTDKATWEMYRDSDNEEKQSWAEQAKMRANKTASVYNEYMLKNSYVFDGNIPADIDYQLEILR